MTEKQKTEPFCEKASPKIPKCSECGTKMTVIFTRDDGCRYLQCSECENCYGEETEAWFEQMKKDMETRKLSKKQKSFTKTGWQIYGEMESSHPTEFPALKKKEWISVDGLVKELQKRRDEAEATRTQSKVVSSPNLFAGRRDAFNEVLARLGVKEK